MQQTATTPSKHSKSKSNKGHTFAKEVRLFSDENYQVVLDRQIRPALIATCFYGAKFKQRKNLSKTMFLDMISKMRELIGQDTNATITWNCGKWRRSGPFHLKAFMSVPDFMSKYLRLQPRLAGKESELQYRDEMLHLVIDTAILLPYSTEFSAIKVDPTHNSGPFFYVPFVDLWNSVDDAEKFCEHWKLNGYSLHLLEGKDSIGDFLVLRVDPNDYVRIMNSSDEHNLELEAKEKFLATWEYKQPERKYYNRAN